MVGLGIIISSEEITKLLAELDVGKTTCSLIVVGNCGTQNDCLKCIKWLMK